MSPAPGNRLWDARQRELYDRDRRPADATLPPLVPLWLARQKRGVKSTTQVLTDGRPPGAA